MPQSRHFTCSTLCGALLRGRRDHPVPEDTEPWIAKGKLKFLSQSEYAELWRDRRSTEQNCRYIPTRGAGLES
ncbi:MAG: hypothetical protein NVS1B11_36750 [Terriglobales bacterium]